MNLCHCHVALVGLDYEEARFVLLAFSHKKYP